jgi:drug/metabolite transporter (DMT)-like permease
LCQILRPWWRVLFGLMTRQTALSWGALALTVLIWGSYLVSTRAAMTQSLSAIDVGVLRSVPAALFLLPFILKRGLKPKGATWIDILLIGGGGGTIFTLLLASGFRFAPAADGGLFTPSMLPVFVAILSILMLGRRYAAIQYFGIAMILIGALAVGGFEAISNTASGAWRGHLLFLTASLCWSAYTLRFGLSPLGTIDGAVILLGWSGIAFASCALIFGTHLTSIPTPILILQLFQGFMAGLVANFTFLYAVRTLGSAIPAAGAALVPVIAAIGGWMFLGEHLSVLKWTGIVIVACGVALASGVLKRG